MTTIRMATVWRWMLSVTLALTIFAPGTNIATASQASQKRVQCEGANTNTSGTAQHVPSRAKLLW
jgi:hypothetical protein